MCTTPIPIGLNEKISYTFVYYHIEELSSMIFVGIMTSAKIYARIVLGVTIHGRRLALLLEGIALQSIRKEGCHMSISDLIAILSFGLTCFGIGYSIGSDRKSQ